MWTKDKDDDTILVATHVNNSIVTGSDNDKADTFMHEMLDRFNGTCERNHIKMLGMKWEYYIEADTSILQQRAFTEKLLWFWRYNKSTKSPQAPDTSLSVADKSDTPDPVLYHRYRAIVGALGWLNQGLDLISD